MSKPAPATHIIEASNTSIARMNTMLAVVFALAAAGAWWESEVTLSFDVTARDFNPLCLIVYALALFAAYFLWRSLLFWIRLRRFGRTTLECAPARPGYALRAVLRGTREIQATGPWLAWLRCVKTERRNDIGEGAKHYEKVCWESKTRIEQKDLSLLKGIPIEISIPSDALRSSGDPLNTSAGRVRWILEVSAPVRGPNFHAIFLVEVG
ncbi:hypothetical protein BH11PSE11_BH11PSE11_34470 [soil metagenome]